MKRLTDTRLMTTSASGISTPYYPLDMADLHARFNGLHLGQGDKVRIEWRDPASGAWHPVRSRAHAGSGGTREQ